MMTQNKCGCCSTQSTCIPFQGIADLLLGCCMQTCSNTTQENCGEAKGTLPIGMEIFFGGKVPPDGWLDESIDHGLLVRADYPELFGFAKDSGNIITDDEWEKLKKQDGSVGYFSFGNDETTFRIPLLKKVFFRCADADDAMFVGTYQQDAIRNIVGHIGVGCSLGAASSAPSGALLAVQGTKPTDRYLAGSGDELISFDASKVVPAADENRPIAVSRVPIIKAKNVASR